jgi:tetratricopeptide (TPR) repeat protein
VSLEDLAALAWSAASSRTHVRACPHLVLLKDQGEVEGARAAYQQAIDSGHHERAPIAALELGDLLKKQGEVEGARAAYQQAIDSGHHERAPMAAVGLALMLEEQGEVEGARAAFQQAIDSGHHDWSPEPGKR